MAPACPLRWTFRTATEHRRFTCIPRVTAIQNGQQISTSVVGFQRISENQSVSSFSALYGGAFYDGILLNPADSGSFNLDVRLNDRIPNPDEPVQWSLDFDVLTPNFPIDPAQFTITEDGDSRILTWDNMERDCLTAYQNGQILTDGLDSLFSYALYLPVPERNDRGRMGADRFGKPSDTLRRI